MNVQISLPKLQAMHADWKAAAIAKALPVDELRKRLEAARSASLSFSASEVGEMLTMMSAFYKTQGRVDALADLLRDLGSPVLTDAATGAAPAAAAEQKPASVRRIGQ